MTLGGITSSLNLTLARLNSIESNFQALNNIAIELDFKQSHKVQNNQDSDFKTILDGKVNAVENKEEIKQEPLIPEIEEAFLEENNEILPNAENEENQAIQEVKVDDISDEIEEVIPETPNFKSKLDYKSQAVGIDEIIETLSEKYNVDSDFIKAIIKQESGFNPNATSKKGAMGLMQLMPSTAKSLGVKNAYNPWENIEGGVRHIRGLLDKYGNNRELALAAYNAGEGAVKKYGGIPPYKETQNYVKSIMGAYTKVKEAEI